MHDSVVMLFIQSNLIRSVTFRKVITILTQQVPLSFRNMSAVLLLSDMKDIGKNELFGVNHGGIGNKTDYEFVRLST